MGTVAAITSEPDLVASLRIHAANDDQPDLVLAVDDVARMLRIGRNTVYELVGRNEIPHRRLGKQIYRKD